MPNFAKHLCRRGAIVLLPLSHLSSNSLLGYFAIFSPLCDDAASDAKASCDSNQAAAAGWAPVFVCQIQVAIEYKNECKSWRFPRAIKFLLETVRSSSNIAVSDGPKNSVSDLWKQKLVLP